MGLSRASSVNESLKNWTRGQSLGQLFQSLTKEAVSADDPVLSAMCHVTLHRVPMIWKFLTTDAPCLPWLLSPSMDKVHGLVNLDDFLCTYYTHFFTCCVLKLPNLCHTFWHTHKQRCGIILTRVQYYCSSMMQLASNTVIYISILEKLNSEFFSYA